ncbi:MAG TPA: DUF3311 domain-containing protein [Streptosporangiaceae bacterium]|nr:DUF3311 domain-containing protein [Streptosporangiaceae bacterium]
MNDNRRQRRRRPVVLLLALPLIAVLIPEFYNFGSPAIGGMPFFYWWQLAWIAGVAVCTGIVYRATRTTR